MQTKHLTSSKFSWLNAFFSMGIFGLLLLSGCGGSESEDIVFLSSNNDINVALVSSEASATADYDPASAPNVNDGFTEPTSDFWSGIASGDSVTIDFGKIRYLKEIEIFTNNNTNQTNKRIEISTDNSNWSSTVQSSGGDIICTSLVTNTSSIKCSYSSRQQARYLKFTTLTTSLLSVFEIQAIGY